MVAGNVRRPYDGQALWFAIDLANYNTGQVGITYSTFTAIKKYYCCKWWVWI
jgi:hypothetical protein